VVPHLALRQKIITAVKAGRPDAAWWVAGGRSKRYVGAAGRCHAQHAHGPGRHRGATSTVAVVIGLAVTVDVQGRKH
jgi:hypothetical protein